MPTSSPESINRHYQRPQSLKNSPEILPILVPGSPLIPLLIARTATPWRDWLALLKLADRSGGARTCGLRGKGLAIALLFDIERSIRQVETHSAKRVGIEVSAMSRQRLASHCRTCGLGLLGVFPTDSPAYLAENRNNRGEIVGPPEGSIGPESLKREARPNQHDPTSSDPSQPPPPWTNWNRVIEGAGGIAPVEPLGWHDSRISAGFPIDLPA